MERDSIFKRLPLIFVLSSVIVFLGFAVARAQAAESPETGDQRLVHQSADFAAGGGK